MVKEKMRRILKWCSCGNCGQKKQYNEVVGITLNDRGLDGNPNNKIFFENLQICPVCQYCSWNIENKPSDIQKEIMCSKKYKSIVENSNFSELEKKLRLEILLSYGDENNLANACLHLLWYLENSKKSVIEEQSQTIYYLKRYLENNADIDMACIYIDCCRRMGKFEESKESISSLRNYVGKRKRIKEFLDYEERLCIEKDSNAHKTREIEE